MGFRSIKGIKLGIWIVFINATFCLINIDAQENVVNENGFNRFFYPNGQVASEGMMVNGKPDGYWKTYYVTGVLKSEGNRKNFLLDSIWLFYTSTGDTLEKISYMYGKKNGYSYKYGKPEDRARSKNGNIIAKELYINDKKEGKSYYYYPTGELKETVQFVNGMREGISMEYDREGTVITLMEYRNDRLVERQRINRRDEKGNKQGTWIELYEDGSVRREINYTDNVMDGIYREFDREGNLVMILHYKDGRIKDDVVTEGQPLEIRQTFYENGMIKTSGAYRNNIPVGIHRAYNERGEVIASEIYNEKGEIVSKGIVTEQGERNGSWVDYYPGGIKKAEGEYRNNRRSGRWVFYTETGRTEQEGEYRNGLENGTWKWYYPDGSLWREEEYFNGKEDGMATEYAEDGSIIAQGDYVEGEKEGEWTYVVGDHQEKGSYLVGLREGEWNHFYEDGTLKFRGNYVQGNPDGWHYYHYPDGTLMEEQYYAKGIKERNWKKYDKTGHLILTVTYRNNQEYRINGIRTKLAEREVILIR